MLIEFQLKTPPSIEPITLAETKAWLKVDHSDEDGLIQLLITAARERCESITGLSLMIQQWVAYCPVWPMDCELDWWDGVREGAFIQKPQSTMTLLHGPIRQIDAFQLFDAQGTPTDYPIDQYYLDIVRSQVVLKSGAPLPQGTRGVNPIEITYTTGHEFIPGAIKTGLLKLVAHWYEHRGDESSTLLPIDILSLWQPYQRIRR